MTRRTVGSQKVPRPFSRSIQTLTTTGKEPRICGNQVRTIQTDAIQIALSQRIFSHVRGIMDELMNRVVPR
jgi:hypothetical protein